MRFNYQDMVAGDKKPYIIAELGANHNGDMELAKTMIKTAKECGADCVKLQSFTKTNLFSKKNYDNGVIGNATRGEDLVHIALEVASSDATILQQLQGAALRNTEVGILAVGERLLITIHVGNEVEIALLVDGEGLALVFLRVDGNLDSAAFFDFIARHVVLAQDAELGAAVHLVGGFTDVVVGQFVDEVFGQSCASLEGVAFHSDVVLDGARHTLTIALGCQAQRVDTTDDEVIHNALGTLLRQDVVMFIGVTSVSV